MGTIFLLMLVNFQAKVNTDNNLYTWTVWTQVKPHLDHRRTQRSQGPEYISMWTGSVSKDNENNQMWRSGIPHSNILSSNPGLTAEQLRGLGQAHGTASASWSMSQDLPLMEECCQDLLGLCSRNKSSMKEVTAIQVFLMAMTSQGLCTGTFFSHPAPPSNPLVTYTPT